MATVTVCSKLPFDFVAEHGGKSVTFRGAKGKDPVSGEPYLAQGYGLTPNVDGEWFDAWVEAVGDFQAVKTGAIFSSAPNKAGDESKEKAANVKSGLEQQDPKDMGVEAVAKDDSKK